MAFKDTIRRFCYSFYASHSLWHLQYSQKKQIRILNILITFLWFHLLLYEIPYSKSLMNSGFITMYNRRICQVNQCNEYCLTAFPRMLNLDVSFLLTGGKVELAFIEIGLSVRTTDWIFYVRTAVVTTTTGFASTVLYTCLTF